MRVAVVDLTQADAAGRFSVVNVVMADPAIDTPPDGCSLIPSDEADIAWLWDAVNGFYNPFPPPPPVDDGNAP